MDTELVTAKLESLARCVGRIREKTPPDLDNLRENVDAQDILAVNLERAVQLCVDVSLHYIARHVRRPMPDTMADAFIVMAEQGALPTEVADDLVSAVGFRNLSVHAYDKINWEIVWKILTLHLDVFPKFAAEITRLLKQQNT